MTMMMRIFTLLALAVQTSLAFHPVTPRFGITATTTTTRIDASLDASFEGIDLEKLLGTKKYKKTMKKLQRNANNRRSNSNSDMALSTNEKMKETTAASTQLKATTTDVADESSARAGLKLLIWYA
jgi:hypothetical protein